jgi:hypothetical protein
MGNQSVQIALHEPSMPHRKRTVWIWSQAFCSHRSKAPCSLPNFVHPQRLLRPPPAFAQLPDLATLVWQKGNTSCWAHCFWPTSREDCICAGWRQVSRDIWVVRTAQQAASFELTCCDKHTRHDIWGVRVSLRVHQYRRSGNFEAPPQQCLG